MLMTVLEFAERYRIKEARQEDIRRRELMAEQDARIAKGFAELHTAVELVVQAESGRGPRGDVLRIGDKRLRYEQYGSFKRLDGGADDERHTERTHHDGRRRGNVPVSEHRAERHELARSHDACGGRSSCRSR